jgi:hypothetical protein
MASRSRSLVNQVERFAEQVVKQAQEERDFATVGEAYSWMGHYHHLVAYSKAARGRAIEAAKKKAEEEKGSESEPDESEAADEEPEQESPDSEEQEGKE